MNEKTNDWLVYGQQVIDIEIEGLHEEHEEGKKKSKRKKF